VPKWRVLSTVLCNYGSQNGYFCPKHVCRFFTLNVILAGQYINVNIIFYRRKTDLSIVPHSKEAYLCSEINMPYSGLFSTDDGYVLAFC
jgi:hypothetical protein